MINQLKHHKRKNLEETARITEKWIKINSKRNKLKLIETLWISRSALLLLSLLSCCCFTLVFVDVCCWIRDGRVRAPKPSKLSLVLAKTATANHKRGCCADLDGGVSSSSSSCGLDFRRHEKYRFKGGNQHWGMELS